MKSSAFALIACILILGTMAELTPSEEQRNCVSNISTNSCKSSSTCLADLTTFSSCAKDKCLSASDLSAYGACVTDDCKSSNSEVQAYAEAVRACVYSSIIGLSGVLLVILASLF